MSASAQEQAGQDSSLLMATRSAQESAVAKWQSGLELGRGTVPRANWLRAAECLVWAGRARTCGCEEEPVTLGDVVGVGGVVLPPCLYPQVSPDGGSPSTVLLHPCYRSLHPVTSLGGIMGHWVLAGCGIIGTGPLAPE